ncbi:MAG: I78 family peptidase inhibitor [Sagittula sp.]|jgi:hypothetical protein|uniref:I78 family peptidase inhibitor n=1 Tax=unclassified Sagittula TaxID=2624628 RepID=UPI0024C350BF|nr:I78 family peptidase inhibitor [Sagittula sp. MA-2]WHZ35018.1 I78 family peptidase inhibitor [Sagittula sp. MA-2]
MRQAWILTLVIPALAACEPVTDPRGPAPTCAAGQFAGIVGQPVAAAAAVPDPKRIIRPGDMVTEDYRSNRTNVYLDGQDVITELKCG